MAKIVLRNTKIGGFWTPKLISTVFWYDPSDGDTISTSGSSVTGVTDKSGNSYNLSLISPGISGPTIGNRTLNGLNVFEYPTLVPNSNTALENNSFSYDYSTTPLCISLVIRCDEDFIVDQDFIFAGTDTTTPKRIAARITSDNNIQIFSFDSVPDPDVAKSIQTTVGLATDGKNLLITLKLNSPTSTIRLDGVQRAIGDIGNVPMSFLSFGSNENVQQNLDGFLAEIVGFSDPDKQEIVEGYLAHKWGLVDNLPNEHPYKNKNELYLTPPNVILNSPVFWTPERITKSLWLDAQDSSTIILNGSSVSQWNDKSGNNWHFTQTTAVNQPTYNDNRLTFSGNQRLFNENAGAKQIFKNKTQGTMVAVVKYTSIPTGRTCITFSPASANVNRFILHAGQFNASFPSINYGVGGRRLDADLFRDIGSSTFTANATVIQIGEADWGNSDLRQYINGTLDGVDLNFHTSGSTSNTDSGAVTIGSVGNASFGMIGDIFEILVFDKILTTIERQKLEGYLAYKWGLVSQLPSNHPYKKQKPRI